MELLPPDVAHVWTVDLDAAQDYALPDVLTSAEQERAARFHFAVDAERWITSRKILRMVLARYTGHSPNGLRFSYGPYGKPALENTNSEAPHELHFNLSHSQNQACIAITRDRAVGIDMEYERTNLSPSELAESVFSTLERDALTFVPANEQFTLFFQIWTGKEAYIKTRGQGLSFPLGQLTVLPHETGVTMQVTDLTTKDTPTAPIQVFRMPTSAGYAAALAVEGENPLQIVRKDWHLFFYDSLT